MSNKDEYIHLHVKPHDDQDNIYVLIPKDLWQYDGVSIAVKQAIDLAFFDETKESKQ